MGDNPKRHGVFSLNELLTTDLTSAKRFYGELLGWTFTETEGIYGNPYVCAHSEGEFVGGMMLKKDVVPDDVPCLWDASIAVDDVEASAQRVVELGGKIVQPITDIPKVGRFCVINDPQGASLNLITYEDNT